MTTFKGCEKDTFYQVYDTETTLTCVNCSISVKIHENRRDRLELTKRKIKQKEKEEF